MLMSKTRVLFVDDDPFFSDLGQDTLNEQGFSVVTAANGAEALGYIQAELFDLVIVDNEMPGLSGFEVIDQMRRLENGADVPVIMVTGSDDEASINKAFDVGADSFLPKPFDWSLLVHQANFVLKAARSTKELREALSSQELLRTMQERFVQTLIAEAQKPLKTAVNFARIMKSEPDGPLGSDYYRSCVDEIFQAMERVSTTFVKLVHRSDLGAQVAQLDESMCSVQELATENIEWAHRQAHRRNIDVTCKVSIAEKIQLRCDRVLLIHAMKKVMQDAIDCSPRGSAIEFSILCDAARGIRFIVDDKDPVGPVGSEQNTNDEESQLVSLALQTCKVVVDAHGGRMKLGHLEYGKRVEIFIPSDRLTLTPDAANSETEFEKSRAGLLKVGAG